MGWKHSAASLIAIFPAAAGALEHNMAKTLLGIGGSLAVALVTMAWRSMHSDIRCIKSAVDAAKERLIRVEIDAQRNNDAISKILHANVNNGSDIIHVRGRDWG